jgi:outer membrane protein OmpA-like peptidoglycan-associated protein
MTNLLSHLSSPEADTSVLTVMSSDAKDIGANSLVHELDKVLNFTDRQHKGFANSVSRVSIALDTTMRLIAHTIDMQSDVTFDFDKISLQEQLNQIITALENYDAEAINKIALLVSEYGHTTYAHHINHIKQNANMYDFEGALDAAIQLRGLLDNDD